MSKDSSSNTKHTQHTDSAVSRYAHAAVVTGSVIVLFIFVQLIAALLAGVFMLLVGVDPESIDSVFERPVVLLLYSLVVDILLIGGLYGVYKLWQADFITAIKLKNKLSRRNLAITLALYIAYFMSFAFVWVFVAEFVPAIDTQQTQDLGFSQLAQIEYVYAFIALVILPPIAEEVLFRGVLYNNVKRYINIKVAAVITSIVFGAAHLELLGGGSPNWIAALDTLVFSFFLIYAYEKTNSLRAPIIIHALKNCIAFFAVFVFV